MFSYFVLSALTQVAVVEGEIIITTTGNLDTGHNHRMIFSSGQTGGQLQLICKPCPQTALSSPPSQEISTERFPVRVKLS